MQGFVWEHLVSFPDQYTKLLIVWASDSGNETDACFRTLALLYVALYGASFSYRFSYP